MKSKIKILDENLVNLIAAGEVVERPASVLKELLENSIDAGSTRIIVNINDYGNRLIEVKDNGVGMEEADALLAFVQHATSKISKPEDLNSIKTLGFRGEALASIRAVSQKVILETKSSVSQATKLTINKDAIVPTLPKRTDEGTTISVMNLFGNVPARKKFLKTPSTELKNLINTFLNIALIQTSIHFEIYHNSKILYRLTKTNNLKDRFFEIWGKELTKDLYDEKRLESSICNILAYLGSPEAARKTVANQLIYVNGRYVNDRLIASAVANAYSGFIHKDLKPTYFISIHTDPGLVDVNVHPRKLEIKFSNPSEIYRTVYVSCRKWLEEQTKSTMFNKLGEHTLINHQEQQPEKIEHRPRSEDKGAFFVKEKKSSYIVKSPNRNTVQNALSFSEYLLTVDSTTDRDTKDKQQLQYGALDSLAIAHPSQLFNTYILIEKEGMLVFIDQHAASEKVLFERILKEIANIKTKPLLIPEIIELKAIDKQRTLENKGLFGRIGLKIEDFGGNAIQVTETPEIIEKPNLTEIIKSFLEEDSDLSSQYAKEFNRFNDITEEIYLLLATTACHSAIRAGQKLSPDEMNNLVEVLFKLENPYNCPHGRPVMWEMQRSELEKKFKRII